MLEAPHHAPSLATLIQQQTSADGSHATAMPNVFLTRYSSPQAPRSSVNKAVLCIVAQGAKSLLVNGERLHYDEGTYLILSLDLPLAGQVERATADRPLLCWSMTLDLSLLRDVMEQVPPSAIQNVAAPRPGPAVSPLEPGLLSAVTRLTAMLRKPAQLATFGPLLQREIYCHLLLGPHGTALRRIVTQDGRMQRVSAGIQWLRTHRDEAIRVADLARAMRMSASSMHSAFRQVTGMSPLQFQKQLRLQEARRTMLVDNLDAATAAFRVGYRSASQFSREYRRFFGAPPAQDVARLRTAVWPIDAGASSRSEGHSFSCAESDHFENPALAAGVGL